MIFNWFKSRTAREADEMRKHVEKMLAAQRDILSPEAIGTMEAALRDLQGAVLAGAPDEELKKQMENVEKAANKSLKPYPNASIRENVEVLLVALAVAMAIRTFFLQPFKIPTGSMQPTLYGVTATNLIDRADFVIPKGLDRVKEWFQGISYIHIVAESDGALDEIYPPVGIKIINFKQTLVIGGKPYTIWFPPDYGDQTLEMRAQIQRGRVYHKGEDVIKLRISAGDHLFVDRVTYNFRAPDRGDIIVFETKGIPEEQRRRWGIPGDQFYIKRLCGLGNETLALAQDYEVTGVPTFGRESTVPVGHLVVNGRHLSTTTPHFENLYS